MRTIHDAILLGIVYVLGMLTADTRLPDVKLQSTVILIGPNGLEADEADMVVIRESRKER